jgi:hypothetical protein
MMRLSVFVAIACAASILVFGVGDTVAFITQEGIRARAIAPSWAIWHD